MSSEQVFWPGPVVHGDHYPQMSLSFHLDEQNPQGKLHDTLNDTLNTLFKQDRIYNYVEGVVSMTYLA